jgi:Family of unknown function (DUF6252)
MKKLLFLVVTVFCTLLSCQDDVTFNNPAFQAVINNELWKANFKSAILDRSGAIIIKGTSQFDNLELNIASSAVGTYKLGTVNQNTMATFFPIKGGAPAYSTGITKGSANSVTLINNGSGYSSGFIVPTTGGSGTGLKVDVVANTNGQITEVKINVPGIDYLPGDIITITGGNVDAQFTIGTTSKSNGEIIITENTGSTITGNFKFIAYDELTKDIISCREGVFYKLPITTN